jgi:hypothetical protein
MNFTQIANPKWNNAEHTSVDAIVTFEGVGTVPFTADINDPLSHVQEVFTAIVAGNAGPISEYVPPPAPDPLTVFVPVDPATVSTTPLQFIGRFTDAEQLAVATAAMQNAQVFLWFNKLTAAQQVVFADIQLANGMNALVAAGLITHARSLEILPANVRSSGVTAL